MTRFQADHDIAAWRCHWCGYPVALHVLGETVIVDGFPAFRIDGERFEREVMIHERYCGESPINISE